MVISREENERRWKEIVDSNIKRLGDLKVVKKEVKRDWKKRSRLSVNRKELVSNLKGFVVLLVFWILFGLVMELV
jgi:hypothetical protein